MCSGYTVLVLSKRPITHSRCAINSTFFFNLKVGIFLYYSNLHTKPMRNNTIIPTLHLRNVTSEKSVDLYLFGIPISNRSGHIVSKLCSLHYTKLPF